MSLLSWSHSSCVITTIKFGATHEDFSMRVACRKRTILGEKYSSWFLSTLMKTMSYHGPNIKHQSQTLMVSVLLLNVLYIVGNVDCYHSWSSIGSQPKVRSILLKLVKLKTTYLNAHLYFRSQLTMCMDHWLIQ